MTVISTKPGLYFLIYRDPTFPDEEAFGDNDKENGPLIGRNLKHNQAQGG